MIEKKMLILAIICTALFYPVVHAVSMDGANADGVVIAGMDQSGSLIQYTYNKDRLLVHAQIGLVGITYNYTAANLLAYASTDKGSGYTVSRDRANRTVRISGANSTLMNVTYVGETNMPLKIEVVDAHGQLVIPYQQSANTEYAQSRRYTIWAVDQSLTEIYEAYAFGDKVSTDLN